MRKIPPLSVDLIRQLDEDEGKLRIRLNTPLRDIIWQAARRDLIDYLKQVLEEEEEDNPNT